MSETKKEFDVTGIGESAMWTFTISNTGTADLLVDEIEIEDVNESEFSVSPRTARIAPNHEPEVFTVIFTPQTQGIKTANILIHHNDPGSPTVIRLAGRTPLPILSVIPSPLDFGHRAIGNMNTFPFKISNTGTADLYIDSVSTYGGDADMFTHSLQTPVLIPEGRDTTFQVMFLPGTAGKKSTDLSIYHNALESPRRIGLTGTGNTKLRWSVDIILSNIDNMPNANPLNREAGTRVLTFGLAEGATDGIDVEFEEKHLPPMPPGNQFEAYILLSGRSAEGSHIAYLNSDVETAVWVVKFQTGTAGFPVTLSWNRSTLPEAGSIRIQDLFSGLNFDVDMRTQDILILNDPIVNQFQVVYQTDVEFLFELSAGWHLVSLPVIPQDPSLKTLFPDALSAFTFDGRYHSTEVLEPGVGYWLHLGEGGTYSVPGSVYTIAVSSHPQRWSSLGSPWGGTARTSIEQIPTDNILSIFGFSGKYYEATNLEPGKGYLIHLKNSGSLISRGGDRSAMKIAGKTAPIETQKIKATEGTLWVKSGKEQQDILLGIDPEHVVELPPVPPGGLFDVRIDLDGVDVLHVPVALEPKIYPFHIQGEDIKLSWNGVAEGWEILIDGKKTDMIGTGSIDMDLTGKTLFLRRRPKPAPLEYDLEQNIPNPFNSLTTITYQIPTPGVVSLVVFNTLGQQVRVLARKYQEEGTYRATWDGTDEGGQIVSSGIYFYRIQSGKYEQTRQMLLLK